MDYRTEAVNENASVKLSYSSPCDGIEYVRADVDFGVPTVPGRIRIKFSLPVTDAYSVFSPSLREMRNLNPSWRKRNSPSRLASWMPLHSIVSMSGRNRITVALSDALIPTEISSGVKEETAEFEFYVSFFTQPTTPIEKYSAVIRIDTRDVKYYDSLYNVTEWWENECGYTPAYIPEDSRNAVNSIWYSFHQQIDVDEVVRQCALSKPLGMDTVIVDDGWQTADNGRGYAYCGDWETAPAKVPDMKTFVDRVHGTGMKFVLWYSVPFVGIYTKAYEKFRTMLLRTESERKWYPLDPRYKEVREYIVSIYTKAMREWGLDGFKLDFIDSFSLGANDTAPDPRRDCESLENAVDMLMVQASSALREINPEVMIEFRQSYVGPSIRKYGNMLRVHDCPNDPICNRVEIINLRFTSGKTPVHSDMLMWHPEDTVESAALQMASVLYSVPQISVLIDKLPESHIKMLSYYLAFWKEHRDVLLDGKVTADNPESLYSKASARLGDREVITLYTNTVVSSDARELVAVNASMGEDVYIKGLDGCKYRTVNCMGEPACSGFVASSIEEVRVPVGGMIFVERV